MKLSLTGIENPSIWAAPTSGAAILLVAWPLTEHRRKRGEAE
jgi:hypothetical protein